MCALPAGAWKTQNCASGGHFIEADRKQGQFWVELMALRGVLENENHLHVMS